MAKKVSKYFRIGVEGDTCDGRVIAPTISTRWPSHLIRASTVAVSIWNI